MQGKEDLGVGGERINDAWWATLAGRLLPRTQVQIIEALRWIDRPLSTGELYLVCDEGPTWLTFCRHLRRLTHLRAITYAALPSGSNPLEVPYRLARGDERDGR